MTLVRPTADDPLFRMADQVPLGCHLVLVAANYEMPSEPDVRPFGLRDEPTVLTQSFDVTADGVVDELDRRGCRPKSCTTDDSIGTNYSALWGSTPVEHRSTS